MVCACPHIPPPRPPNTKPPDAGRVRALPALSPRPGTPRRKAAKMNCVNRHYLSSQAQLNRRHIHLSHWY